ncbi:MAG: L,D-transpeptidase [Bacteroidales bacterium]|nr:L,D-transpeptidase [Bacteroidales bacterium]
MKPLFNINAAKIILHKLQNYLVYGRIKELAAIFLRQAIDSIWRARKAILLIGLCFYVFFGVQNLQELFVKLMYKPGNKQPVENQELNEYQLLLKETERTRTKFSSLVPRSAYLVINSTENEFFLYKNRELIRTGKCSTGSYINLKGENNKEWVFKTPKGMHRVRGKVTDPVWKKPDWAFVEEGLPIPSLNHASRYEYGVLGDYALSLGDGYMLHGTLYKRFIGLPVTHGCIRLGDNDLEAIFKSLSIGSKVIIY